MADSQRPLRLLCIDGGGIRGLSSLYILRSIMNNLESKVADSTPRPLLPCNYFDLIGGTSTGGLIAVMLGTLRMDINSCINEYLAMAPRIFPTENLISGGRYSRLFKGAVGKQQFNPEPLERAIKELVKKYLGSLDVELGDQNTIEDTLFRFEASRDQIKPECKVFVCVTSERLGEQFLFRSYNSQWAYMDDCPIWQACRATSAAPTFFPPMYIGNPPRAYVDGALKYNNPIRMLMEESRHLWPSRDAGCIVSIGTGIPALLDVGKKLKPLLDFLIKQATDTERAAQEFQNEMSAKHGRQQPVYHRFNVQHGLENIGLEEWKLFDKTVVATDKYVKDNWDKVDACTSQIWEPSVPNSMSSAFMMPYEVDPSFIGRQDSLQQIDKIFRTRRRAAISGIGGVGKSQIAIQYLYQLRERQSRLHFFWVYSATIARFEQCYIQIAEKLNIPGRQDRDNDIKRLVLDWLSDKNHGDWFMVLDNADDRSIFYPTSSIRARDQEDSTEDRIKPYLSDYLPPTSLGHGKLLITTRDKNLGRDLANDEEPVAIEPFNDEDAETLLKSKVKENQWDPESAKPLLERLGYMPLAITQAAAYVKRNSITLRRYLSDLNKNESNMAQYLSKDLLDPRREKGMPSAIFLTWQLSFEQISESEPIAASMLCLMAFLDSRAVPEMLLSHEETFSEEETSAVGALVAFSLITVERDGETYSMHPLVQLSTQSWVYEKKTQWQAAALRVLAFKAPNGKFENWETWKSLLPHALAVLQYDDSQIEEFQLDKASLLRNLGSYELDQGHYKSGLLHVKNSYDIRYSILGKENPKTLVSLSDLAISHTAIGNLGEGESINKEVLKIREEVLGSEHILTLSSMHNLARVYSEQGKLNDARKLYEELIALYKRVSGEEGLYTLTSIRNLATLLLDEGYIRDAEKLFREAEEVHTRVLGREHPETLLSRYWVAETISRQGKWLEAESLHFEILQIRKRVLGEDHPVTFISIVQVGIALRKQGKYEEAKDFILEALEKQKAKFGVEDQNTLATMEQLALTYSDLRNFQEAEEIYTETIEIRKRKFGEEQHATLSSLHNFAVLCRDNGSLEKAEELFYQVLEAHRRALGPEHPDTIIVLRNIASNLYKQNRLDEALEMMKDVVQKENVVLGGEHPDTLSSMYQLSLFLYKKGCLDQAFKMMGNVVQKRKAVLGDKHPNTLNSINCLEYMKADRAEREDGEDDKDDNDDNEEDDKGKARKPQIIH